MLYAARFAYNATKLSEDPIPTTYSSDMGASIDIAFDVPELCDNILKKDRETTIQAQVTSLDAQGNLTGGWGDSASITIKRYRAPDVRVYGNPIRKETSVTVNLKCYVTGYDLETQDITQQFNSDSIEYSTNQGATWLTATVTWTGFIGQFIFSSLNGVAIDADDTFPLWIRATNKKPPASSPLAVKTSAPYKIDVYSYLPAFSVLMRPNATAQEQMLYAYAQGIVIGDTPNKKIDKWSADIKGDLDVGGSITAGGAAVITGTPGTPGNLAAWNEDGDLVDGLEHQGDNNSGYYKYADGRLECYYVKTFTDVNISAGWGGAYYLNTQTTGILFPVPFTRIEYEYAISSFSDPSTWVGQGMSAGLSLTNWINFLILSMNTRMGINGKLYMYAKGRWK